MKKHRKLIVYNAIFIITCAGILFVLLKAPPETTAYLPKDDNHMQFMTMERKEAERFCFDCHGPDGIAPLPEAHPQPFRCLFCHKRE